MILPFHRCLVLSVPITCFDLYIDESRHIQTCHVARMTRHATHVTYWTHTWMRHVTYGWVTSRVQYYYFTAAWCSRYESHISIHISMSRVIYEWVTSHYQNFKWFSKSRYAPFLNVVVWRIKNPLLQMISLLHSFSKNLVVHIYVWHDSSICDTTYLYVWHDSSICDTTHSFSKNLVVHIYCLFYSSLPGPPCT